VSYDLLVAGTGVAGALTAFYAVKKGLTVALIDRAGSDGGATKNSAAMLLHQTEEKPLTELAKFSLNEYFSGSLSALNGTDKTRAVKTGSVLYATNQDDVSRIIENKKILEAAGVASEMLELSSLTELCPAFDTEGVKAATYCADDGYLDISGFMAELKSELTRMKVDFYESTEPTYSLERKEDCFAVNMQTSVGPVTLSGRKFVIAAGLGSESLARQLNDEFGPYNRANTAKLSIDQGGFDGIRASERLLVRFGFTAKDGGSVATFPLFENVSDQWYVRPDVDSIVVGVGVAKDMAANLVDPNNQQIDPELVQSAVDYMGRRFPGWIVEMRREWLGRRPMSTDLKPIVGQSPNDESLYYICGLSEFGVTTAPACASMLVDKITEETTVISTETVDAVCPRRTIETNT
jgi:glycine/D-amino acid oxidase-like deaminating enzyme